MRDRIESHRGGVPIYTYGALHMCLLSDIWTITAFFHKAEEIAVGFQPVLSQTPMTDRKVP